MCYKYSLNWMSVFLIFLTSSSWKPPLKQTTSTYNSRSSISFLNYLNFVVNSLYGFYFKGQVNI